MWQHLRPSRAAVGAAAVAAALAAAPVVAARSAGGGGGGGGGASRARTPPSLDRYDVAVVGGGIVGLAAARELQLRHPSLSIAVLEKEASLAAHQTGHNSGVVHSGVYYSPGSLKARLCVEGNRRAYAYCDARGIPYQKVGKLIVALDDRETLALMRLWQRARANGVEGAQLLTTPEQVREAEPHCAGVAAIRCPSTGVVDWARVARSYADDFQTAGGEVLTQREVVRFHAEDAGENTIAKPAEPVKAADMASEAEGAPRASSSSSVTEAAGDSAGAHDTTILCADGERILARRVVVCAGLHADRLASAAGCSALPRIVPFRGDYLVLNPDKRYLVKGNIYPVPDARYPFLGVHFTPRPDGAMWLGPNAVLAFSREGYAMGDVSLRDLWEALTFEGFRRLAWSNLAFGVDEMWRALYLPAQVARLKRYIPELEVGDVTRGPSGVRAQALDEQGNLVEDFTFSRAPEGAGDGCATQLHCRNAPSPAATSSLPIGEAIADEAERAFGLPRMPAAPIDAPRRTSGKVGAQRGWWWQRRQQRDR